MWRMQEAKTIKLLNFTVSYNNLNWPVDTVPLYSAAYISRLQVTNIKDNFPLGSSLSINCTTELAVSVMEWLEGEDILLMDTIKSYLTLQINSVTANHHNVTYTCRVISPFGNQSKSLILHVSQQLPTNSVAGISGGVVAVLIIVTLVGLVLTIFIVIR